MSCIFFFFPLSHLYFGPNLKISLYLHKHIYVLYLYSCIYVLNVCTCTIRTVSTFYCNIFKCISWLLTPYINKLFLRYLIFFVLKCWCSQKSNIQYTDRYSLPHTGYSLPHTGYSLPHTRYSLPHTGYSLPHTGYSLPHTGYSCQILNLSQRLDLDGDGVVTLDEFLSTCLRCIIIIIIIIIIITIIIIIIIITLWELLFDTFVILRVTWYLLLLKPATLNEIEF